MATQRNEAKLMCHDLDSRAVVSRFDGGEISSDAGAVLLREVEKRTHRPRMRSTARGWYESTSGYPGTPS